MDSVFLKDLTIGASILIVVFLFARHLSLQRKEFLERLKEQEGVFKDLIANHLGRVAEAMDRVCDRLEKLGDRIPKDGDGRA